MLTRLCVAASQSITTEKTREETLARARAAAPSTESAPAAAPVGVRPAAGSRGGGGTGLHWDAGGAWLADQWRPEGAATGQVPPPTRAAAATAAAGGAPSDKLLIRRRRRRRRSSKALCLELQSLHDVRPGLSWGSLPGGQREAWSTMGCDSLLHTGGGGAAAGFAAASIDAADGRALPKSDAARAPSTVAECSRVGRAHRVVGGVSWGALPTSLRRWWASADCDRLLSGPRAEPPVQGAPDTLPRAEPSQRAEAPLYGQSCPCSQQPTRPSTAPEYRRACPRAARWTRAASPQRGLAEGREVRLRPLWPVVPDQCLPGPKGGRSRCA